MHLTYAKMLAIVMRQNMKLGDNTLHNERLTFVNTKFLPKYSRIVALILLPYSTSIILKLKGHIKGRLISRFLIFFKNLSSGLKIIRQFVKVDQNIQKPLTKAARYILIKSFFLAIGWSYLHGLSHTFLKRLKLLWGEIACQKRLIFYR